MIFCEYTLKDGEEAECSFCECPLPTGAKTVLSERRIFCNILCAQSHEEEVYDPAHDGPEETPK